MYLKDESGFFISGTGGAKYWQTIDYVRNTSNDSYRDVDIMNEGHEEEETNSTTSYIINDAINTINSYNKCLFYTIFFSFIGYLVYYIFKDAV
jgi:hypothetical protein